MINIRTNIAKTVAWVVLLLCCGLGAFNVNAETVSQKQARQIAQKFFDKAYGRPVTAPEYSYNGRRLTTGSYFAPFYIFNHPLGGFVIISAENKMYPILGYSLTDKFDPKQMGPVQQKLLTLYARHIEYIRYNSEPIWMAELAWQDIDAFIAATLTSPLDITEPKYSSAEASALLDWLAQSDNLGASSSDIYTPEQWESMIDEELLQNDSAVVGLIDEKGISPVVVYGTKGAFYKLLLDTPDNAVYRLMPSEVMNFGQIAILSKLPEVAEEGEEDTTYRFIEQILQEAEQQIAETRGIAADDLSTIEPIVRDFRGGHYIIHLPEGAMTSRTFSLEGAEVHRAKHNGSNTIAVDISGMPTGFYFVVIYGESGQPYGLKLFR